MLDHFNPEARRAVVFAADEARDLGHDHIGTEHLFLGLLRLGDPAITGTGLTLRRARADVRHRLGGGTGGRTIGELRFTEAAKRALVRADTDGDDKSAGPAQLLAALLDDDGSGVAQLIGDTGDDGDALLALVADRRGVSARALASLGVDERKLRRAVEEARQKD